MSSAQQDHQTLPRVAVLGIGTMGRGMAHSLLRAGFTVDAWNRTPEPAAQLAAVTFVGFGTAGTAFGSMVTATKGVANPDQGFVGGVINTGRQIGAGIGAALLPAIALTVSHGGHTAGVSGDRAAMLAGAVAAGLATLIAVSMRTRPAARPGQPA